MRTILPILILAAGCASAAEIPAETRLAIKALGEFAQVCEADGARLWGKSLCGPLVLAHPSTRAAVANRRDPDGAFQKSGEAFLGVFPERFTPSNTSIQWGGEEWANVMLPLPADPYERVSLLAHESFHRIQGSLGLAGSDAPNAHLNTEAGRLWLRLELRALARAMRTEGPAGRQSAADAMLFRLLRHRLCPGSEATEAAMEKQEGLAEYTGVFVALRATGEDISRPARAVEAFEDESALARSFAYATGPALGVLLDRYADGWRKRAASVAMSSLLIAALQVQTPQDIQSVAQQRARAYGYAAVALGEHEREERNQVFLAELTKKFIDGATLRFPSASELSRNFNPRSLVPFPPHGTYYPTGTFSAKWGKLTVQSGGALLAPDNMSLRVPAPLDPDARPVRGEGWVLQLERGWSLRPSEPSGTFTLVPPER